MINEAGYIRQGFYAALNNNVTYNSSVVPVWENEDGDITATYQIRLKEMSRVRERNKSRFMGRWNMVIEVIHVQHNSSSRKHVDAIGSIMMNIITPTPRAKGVSISEPLQILNVQIDGQDHLTDKGANGESIVRLITRISFSIHQH